MPYFHFRCVARATFDRNLIYSADACFLVMACVVARAAKNRFEPPNRLIQQENGNVT